ncbi:MAG TPA: PH domain-containing protein [Candidatus Limnocylindria bacterium]|jgi:membrane protein YdbS with pleckstrin-like domain|nr:PH domain-containing protein [Candidatus Limnocylindria bacterium]
MFDEVCRWLLRILRVPPEPEPPAGAPDSIRVFRAGRNYFRFRLALWGLKQFAALVAIIFWFVALHLAQAERDRGRGLAESTPPTPAVAAPTTVETAVQPPATVTGDQPAAPRKKRRNDLRTPDDWRRAAAKTPDWVFHALWAVKLFGVAIYLIQIPITYGIRRLDYEQRWYIVTDRSLRLRSGVWSLREMTMSFANLQQITVAQGPLQRLLGIADVRVQSAGGGGATQGHYQHGHQSLHTGLFHAVEHAEEIRDLITERLRRFRETGLGDPDERHHHQVIPPPLPASSIGDSATLVAANELLAEAKALRASLN